MTNQFFTDDLLMDFEYYRRVLMDGMVISNGRDLEMCDLRCFMDRYSNSEKPIIQVYKANKGREEFIKTYENYELAFSVFRHLNEKGSL